MSLFSIVQNARPVPVNIPAPAPAPMGSVPPMPPTNMMMPGMAQPGPMPPQPQMPMPNMPSATGYSSGGMMSMSDHDRHHREKDMDDRLSRLERQIGFEGDYNRFNTDHDSDARTDRYMAQGVMNVPGYRIGEDWVSYTPPGGVNPPPGGTPSTGNPILDGRITQLMYENAEMSYDDAMRIARGEEDAYIRDLNDARSLSGGGAQDTGHYYAQIAEQARQFNLQHALEQQQAADQRKLAQHESEAAKVAAQQDWRRAQLEQQSARRQQEVDAGAQSQNAYLSSLRQADPNQAPLYFSPGLLYESVKRGNAGQYTSDQMPEPNLPSLEF